MSEAPADWNSEPEAEAPAGQEVASDVVAMTFEQALGELERIVQELERGQLDLDAAIRAYERGSELKAHCTTKLREAQLRVERISFAADGKTQAVQVEID